MGKKPLYVTSGMLIVAAAVVEAQQAMPVRPPCAACLIVEIGPDDHASLPSRIDGLAVAVAVEAGAESSAAHALAAVRAAGGRPILLVRGLPRAPLPGAAIGIEALLADVRRLDLGPSELTFSLKTDLATLRGTAPGLKLGVALPDLPDAATVTRDLAPYVDFVLASAPADPGLRLAWWRDGPSINHARHALEESRRTDADRVLMRIDASSLRATVSELAAAVPFLPVGLVDVTGFAASCSGRSIEAWMRLPTAEAEQSSLDHIVWGPACLPSDDLGVPEPFALSSRVDLPGAGVLAVARSTTGERFVTGVDVGARRALTVEQIVARHQAAVARQNTTVRTLISSGTMTLSFEAPGFPAPFTVTSRATFYEGEGQSEIEQRSIRVNGLQFDTHAAPRLPIIEPERVASPPLAIALTDAYRYELAGLEKRGGVSCYLVRFVPIDSGRSSFAGTAWIDVDTFGLVRIAARQTGLHGPIVASEQVEEFRVESPGIWLRDRLIVRQLYEGAAHRTPLDRVLVIDRHEINPADFLDRRAAALASSAVMLRDTPRGYRYLQPAERVADRAQDERESVREATDRATRVKTLVFGTIVDPNISRPLPFAGLSYVDFDLFRTGAQLNAFFGGTYGQLAVSIPSIRRTRWQLGARAFGILTSYNDRAFEGGRERYEENIRQRPMSASVWLVRPLSTQLALRTGYELDFTGFSRADMTAADFAVPADQMVHGLRIALDAQRGGWRASGWWNPAFRSGWQRWGRVLSEYEPRHRDFQRFGASIARSEVLSPGLLVRGEASWMGGRDLDRFSRFAFGGFDNRLRGFPAALIRYDRGAVLRAGAAWSVRSRLRLDASIDTAFVHDPGLASRMTRLTGVGMAVETPAPFGMLLAAEWGYGFQGRRADGQRGTHVVRITGYKLF